MEKVTTQYTIWVLVILLVAALAGLGYYYNKTRATSENPTEVARQKNTKIFEAVVKLVALPQDPNTVVATISDTSKLKDQRFFDLAQNGDNLIIIPSVGKAIIYRASINKIIDIGPYAPAATTTTPATKQPARTQQ